MEWLGTLILGYISDLFQSIFLIAGKKLSYTIFPSGRKKENIKDNVLMLDIMERLKALGKDPDLVKYSREDSDQFIKLISSQKEAFVENEIEIITAAPDTSQYELNMEAGRRADVARRNMDRAIVALYRSGWMNETQTQALKTAQDCWEKYAQHQAHFARAEFEGGSMAPLAFAGELETLIVSRTGELKRLLEKKRERYSK